MVLVSFLKVFNVKTRFFLFAEGFQWFLSDFKWFCLCVFLWFITNQVPWMRGWHPAPAPPTNTQNTMYIMSCHVSKTTPKKDNNMPFYCLKTSNPPSNNKKNIYHMHFSVPLFFPIPSHFLRKVTVRIQDQRP